MQCPSMSVNCYKRSGFLYLYGLRFVNETVNALFDDENEIR